jgi:hypothetical protein
MPSFVPSSGPVEAVPLPNSGGNEPSWKPLNGRSGALPSHSGDLGIVRANVPADLLAAAPVAFIPAAAPDPPPPQHSIPASTSEGPLVVLRSTIETLCAGRARDLEMFHRGPNQLLIRFKVRVGPEAERLAQLISKLPELAPYQVTYEIAVAPSN